MKGGGANMAVPYKSALILFFAVFGCVCGFGLAKQSAMYLNGNNYFVAGKSPPYF